MITTTTVCIRCGRDRILFKKWTEKSETNGKITTNELYVCPDSDCQKIVDAKFAEMRERRMESEIRKSNLKLAKS